MANAIGQVISLWPGGWRRPRSACKRISFVSWIARRAKILRDRAPLALHGIRFNEKIAVESYTFKTGAVVPHAQTKRERGPGLCRTARCFAPGFSIVNVCILFFHTASSASR